MRRRTQSDAATRTRTEEVEVFRGPVPAHRGHPHRHPLDPVEGRVGDLGHALLASRHLVPLEADGPDDLGEGQGEHGEVDARQAHAEEAEHEGEEPGDHARGGKGEEEGHPELLHEDAGGVGPDAEVGGVAEGNEPGVPNEEVKAGGEQCPDDDIVGEERVEARAQRRHEERGDQHEKTPGDSGEQVHGGYLRGRPSRPQGRRTRTVAMRAKMAKMEKRGKKRMPKDSTWP